MSESINVFLSYSHVDRVLAERLENNLRTIARPMFGRARVRVLRDETTLNPGPDLWEEIRTKIDLSEYLILLASPASMASPWVSREATYFLERVGVGRLLLVIVRGELHWDGSTGRVDPGRTNVLPASLLQAFAAEPLYVDLRWADELKRPEADDRWQRAVLDLAATVLGLSKEDVASADAKAKRRTLRWAWAAVGVLSVALATAASLGWEARQRGFIAENRLRAGQEAAGEMISVVDGTLSHARGAREARTELLSQSRRLLEALGPAAHAPEIHIGRSLDALSEALAGSEATATGDLARARSAHARAEAIADQLAMEPGVGARRTVAAVMLEVGTAAFANEDYALGRRALERTVALAQELWLEHPGADETVELATAVDRLGRLAFREGKLDEAKRLHQRGLELVRSLAAHSGTGDRSNLMLAESETLLADVAVAEEKDDSARQYLDSAGGHLAAVTGAGMQLDLARRDLDLLLRQVRYLAPEDLCLGIQQAALELLGTEGDSEDRLRFEDALALCPELTPEVAARAAKLEAEVKRLTQPTLRLRALLNGALGRFLAGDPARRTEAVGRLLEAKQGLEAVLAQSPADIGVRAALARVYQFLLNLPSPEMNGGGQQWAARCTEITAGAGWERDRLDCVISSATMGIAADARAALEKLQAASEQARALDDGSMSARLRSVRMLHLVATAAKFAGDRSAWGRAMSEMRGLVTDIEGRNTPVQAQALQLMHALEADASR